MVSLLFLFPSFRPTLHQVSNLSLVLTRVQSNMRSPALQCSRVRSRPISLKSTMSSPRYSQIELPEFDRDGNVDEWLRQISQLGDVDSHSELLNPSHTFPLHGMHETDMRSLEWPLIDVLQAANHDYADISVDWVSIDVQRPVAGNLDNMFDIAAPSPSTNWFVSTTQSLTTSSLNDNEWCDAAFFDYVSYDTASSPLTPADSPPSPLSTVSSDLLPALPSSPEAAPDAVDSIAAVVHIDVDHEMTIFRKDRPGNVESVGPTRQPKRGRRPNPYVTIFHCKICDYGTSTSV
ncbi:hypothetical protein K474DRAFT_1529193 [Panus rudis PR-1116 ss-1]|nr:hypothetical protein K474DRAFT_1529193 [Panus rudis PR-1116 ss-1]